MTGTILPDLARVATGKERPLARAREVKALAETWVMPEIANIFFGMPLVAPVSCIPTKPTKTLAIASRTWRNQACLN